MYLLYVIALALLLIPILKINNYHLLDNALIFSLITNYLLNFTTTLFSSYYYNFYLLIFSYSLLIIFSFLLIFDIRRVLGYIPLSSLPYLLYNVFSFLLVLL